MSTMVNANAEMQTYDLAAPTVEILGHDDDGGWANGFGFDRRARGKDTPRRTEQKNVSEFAQLQFMAHLAGQDVAPNSGVPLAAKTSAYETAASRAAAAGPVRARTII